MQTYKGFERDLYNLNASPSDSIVLSLFRFQAKNNPIYSSYLRFLDVDPEAVDEVTAIPFLPISFFKTQRVVTGEWQEEVVFTSSGTIGATTSHHFVRSLAFYETHSRLIFESNFGSLRDMHVLALLPSYLERAGSSLVYMIDYFIKETRSIHSGFYLNETEALVRKLAALKGVKGKVLLIGVTFALLDLAERYDLDLGHCMVMETGGMKGRRQEITRDELHRVLCQRFRVPAIYSEYGMTEMLSQAYSIGKGGFRPPGTLRIVLKELNDPFAVVKPGKTGRINVVDLGNADSCAFIETQDLGRMDENGYFEVLGRMDNSDVRGCNLLVE